MCNLLIKKIYKLMGVVIYIYIYIYLNGLLMERHRKKGFE